MLTGLLFVVLQLPNPTRTPGAINPAVTQANIHQTICVPGWTKTIRPPASLTTALKRRQMQAWGLPGTPADYEEDHADSLELGGDPGFTKVNGHWRPTSELNLWPQSYHGPFNAHVKDTLENKLHALVCAGTIPLAEAQHAITTDWIAALKTYGGKNGPR